MTLRFPKERIDPRVFRVTDRLDRAGHAGYLVGGAVRDLLLGLEPKDFDVSTDATPEEVRRIFRNCRIIGRRFRLAHVFFGPFIVEVSSFRRKSVFSPAEEGEIAEGAGEDLLMLDDNEFGTEEEDAERRDLTVNGIFYDVARDRLVDHVGGLADLEARLVRFVGKPDVRVLEDPIRSLRAVRYAARLGFAIEPDSFEAIRRHAGAIGRAFIQRTYEELRKILESGASAVAFELLEATGLLDALLPDLAAASRAFGSARHRRLLATLDHYYPADPRDGDPLESRPPREGMRFACLFLPLFSDLADAEGGPWRFAGVTDTDALLAEMRDRFAGIARRFSVPRAVTHAMVGLLAGMGRLRHPPARRPFALARHPLFPEMLEALHLRHRAFGDSAEAILRWHDHLAGAPGRHPRPAHPPARRPARGQKPAPARGASRRPKPSPEDGAPDARR